MSVKFFFFTFDKVFLADENEQRCCPLQSKLFLAIMLHGVKASELETFSKKVLKATSERNFEEAKLNNGDENKVKMLTVKEALPVDLRRKEHKKTDTEADHHMLHDIKPFH